MTAMTEDNLAELEQLCQELTAASVKSHVSLACHGHWYSEC